MKLVSLSLIAGALISLAGCAGEVSESPEDLGSTTSALSTTSWYYACNATSYNLDSNSKMTLVDNDGAYTLTFTVDPGELVNDNSCQVVQRVVGSDGSDNRIYYRSRTGALTVPNTIQLSTAGTNSTVNYGSRGTFKATVQAAYGSLTVVRVP